MLVALAALAVLLGMTTVPDQEAKPPPAGFRVGRPSSTLPEGAGPGAAAATASEPQLISIPLASTLYSQGSLKGAEPDGVLAADASGRLLVSMSVRRRFDHLLSASGELTPAEITGLLQSQAFAELPGTAVGELMDLWQQYLALLSQRFEHGVDAAGEASVSAALEERSRVRRQLLGPAWADAFFGAEERALRERLSITLSELKPASDGALAAPIPRIAQRPTPGIDPHALYRSRAAALGPRVAERLGELDREESAWDRRLALARSHINGLEHDSATPLPARRLAIDQYLAEHFNGHELIRARALLHRNPQ